MVVVMATSSAKPSKRTTCCASASIGSETHTSTAKASVPNGGCGRDRCLNSRKVPGALRCVPSPQVRHHQPAVRLRAGALGPDLLPDAVRPQRGPVPDQPLSLLALVAFLQQKKLLRPLHPENQPQQGQGHQGQTKVGFLRVALGAPVLS